IGGCEYGVEDRPVASVALVEPFRQRREDMRGLVEHFTRLLRRQARTEFQEDRYEIRQLGRLQEETGAGILSPQIDHCLAALAAVPMNVLEQVKRELARS